ncbi:hypothetical protein SPRG_01633 [Saprolegnia parasitica CBS 223.65]|uniref:Uncharacterized protein n=1 Tax=Saprolegnia parasitica (strain CBS 223.65) TaxID=695850 RepID=A0A067D411_SAPPC|nr:hypothetical protein SPRG_01633 [Saprolegnia parasitica CBS 223.65]KDO33752.1 hypothetical protein SPRG_01633 [Saprolegnia parasitica CBS 223.65]|eukprot:XP_012195390.1 hypothetical protein SPRG_01633 [Saprolegnia parasitica CBS 223.65]
MVHNGAVYLASLLRNVNITASWAGEFENAFASDLRQSVAGQAFLMTIYPPYLPIDDEVAYWLSKNITSYVLQWQNYKSIGFTSAYAIVNAYGAAHTFELESTASFLQWGRETSSKMYWSLFSEFWNRQSNSTYLSRQSLLRASSRFAYQNISLQWHMLALSYLPSRPWSQTYSLVSSHLGPFGSIDMIFVPPPPVLRRAVAAFERVMTDARQAHTTAYLDIPATHVVQPAPRKWKHVLWAVSGSLLCPDQPAIDLVHLETLTVSETALVDLHHTRLLDPSDASFDYFAWLFFYDWVYGRREVISFQGDLGSLTVMGDTLPNRSDAVDASQLPTVFALYARRAVQYVTSSILALAMLSLVYLMLVQGAIEGRNLLKLSRVGGFVWVGRPLIGLRSITALGLLSTASVEFVTDGQLSYFAPRPIPWYTTCLAANEVTWLVNIVSDLVLPWTQWRTPKFALAHSLVVWLISALLATLAPVQATISADPTCSFVTLDRQVQCVMGTVHIGSVSRLLLLIGVVVGCNGVCYGVARRLFPRDTGVRSSSLLLCSGATYLFKHNDWIQDDVYYMDRASAALNGLLSVQWRSDSFYVLDVKIRSIIPALLNEDGSVHDGAAGADSSAKFVNELVWYAKTLKAARAAGAPQCSPSSRSPLCVKMMLANPGHNQ